jgi:peroxiredoxin
MGVLRRLCAAAVVCVALCLGGCAAKVVPGARHPLLGEPMPEFERTTLRGEVLRTGHLRGRVVVVEFFAEYCEPCRYSLPVLEKLRRSHPEVAFIGVSEDEHRADAVWLVRRLGLGFPVVHDEDGRIAARFAVAEMPATFVVDESGTIRWVGRPDCVEAEMDGAIRSLSPERVSAGGEGRAGRGREDLRRDR